MYETGVYIGDGCNSVFCHIKDHPKLGIKIRKEESDKKAFKKLKEEYTKALVLRKLKLPVPRYAGIVRIKINPKTIFSQDPEIDKLLKEKYGKSEDFGLVIENIENDIRVLSEKQVQKKYNFYKKQFRELNIVISDSGSNHNILWSEKKKKMYFIDYEYWTIPSKYFKKSSANIQEENKPKSWFSRLFNIFR